MSNIFRLPAISSTDDERFDTLWSRSGLRVERIVSAGQRSPEDFWFDQNWDEWVVLIQGSAVISFENGERLSLAAGDHLFIPAHRKHRVEETQADPPCIWIALHTESASSAESWIRALQLQPHPEGGFYRECYRSAETISAPALSSRYGASRTLSTSIYFLLKGDQVSLFHRLKSDEIWHFHDGSAVSMFLLRPDGGLDVHAVGRNPSKGEEPQLLIPRGTWFAAAVEEAASYALVGCIVAPGFDFADFEMGKREELLGQFPDHAEVILRFTR